MHFIAHVIALLSCFVHKYPARFDAAHYKCHVCKATMKFVEFKAIAPRVTLYVSLPMDQPPSTIETGGDVPLGNNDQYKPEQNAGGMAGS